jgi:hypothetical protein
MNALERAETPSGGDAIVPADVLKDEHGGALDPLPTVADKINALFDKAAKADEKAESYRISAGLELARARARVDAGEVGQITWTAWCADNIKRSEGDIRKVLAIASAADPAKAAAVERQRNREAIAKHRAYVSAVPGQCAVGAKKGEAAVAEPMPVTIDTVIRDIERLGPDAPLIVIERLLPQLGADQRAEVRDQLVDLEAALTGVNPMPVDPVQCGREDPAAETEAPVPGGAGKLEQEQDALKPAPIAPPPSSTMQPPSHAVRGAASEPSPPHDERPLPPIGEEVDPEAASTIPTARPAGVSDDDDTHESTPVSPDGEEQPSASGLIQPGEDEGQMIRQIERDQIRAVLPESSASMPEAFDGGVADEATKQQAAGSPHSAATVLSRSTKSWFGRVPPLPPGEHCNHKGGVCGADACARLGRCGVLAQSQAAA